MGEKPAAELVLEGQDMAETILVPVRSGMSRHDLAVGVLKSPVAKVSMAGVRLNFWAWATSH
jgi:hypothetical protein